MQWVKDKFTLTDNSEKVDLDITYKLLSKTYWGHRRSREVVHQIVKHSLCFTLLLENNQIGFARAVSDYTVISWIADLVIHPDYRGKGVGKWVVFCVINHSKIRHTQLVLQTQNAHVFYERFGFASSFALMRKMPNSLQIGGSV